MTGRETVCSLTPDRNTHTQTHTSVISTLESRNTTSQGSLPPPPPLKPVKPTCNRINVDDPPCVVTGHPQMTVDINRHPVGKPLPLLHAVHHTAVALETGENIDDCRFFEALTCEWPCVRSYPSVPWWRRSLKRQQSVTNCQCRKMSSDQRTSPSRWRCPPETGTGGDAQVWVCTDRQVYVGGDR